MSIQEMMVALVTVEGKDRVLVVQNMNGSATPLVLLDMSEIHSFEGQIQELMNEYNLTCKIVKCTNFQTMKIIKSKNLNRDN